jgi:hypothetical protein
MTLHMFTSLRRCKSINSAIELRLLSDRPRQLRLQAGALAARHGAAPQLGPQLLDVIVNRNHRALLLFRRRDARAMPGRAGSRTP